MNYLCNFCKTNICDLFFHSSCSNCIYPHSQEKFFPHFHSLSLVLHTHTISISLTLPLTLSPNQNKSLFQAQRCKINRANYRSLDIIRGMRSKFSLCLLSKPFSPSSNVNNSSYATIVHVHSHLIKVIKQLQDISPDFSWVLTKSQSGKTASGRRYL
jgi:hypothetical protein